MTNPQSSADADADADDTGEPIDPAGDGDGVVESEDCDDADASVYPGADEIVGDGIDNDCDGTETCYADADGDGHAAADGSTVHSEDADCDDEGEALSLIHI